MPQKPSSAFPSFPAKHEQESFFSPQAFLAYLRRLGEVPDFIVPENIILCLRAIRDEGVSHHYLPPERYALRALGMRPMRGASWTIDTPYRETVAEARHYQAAGVFTVEMEAAELVWNP